MDATASTDRGGGQGRHALRPPLPVRVLVGCGWISAADASSLRVDEGASSHSVARVILPEGRSVVVKTASPSAGRDLARELFVYRLAAWIPAVAAAVPHPVFLDESRQVVVLEALSTAPAWPDPRTAAPLGAPGVASRLGRLLAGVHRATADLPMGPSPAVGILGLCSGLETAAHGRAPTTCELMRLIAGDAELRPLLEAGAAGYRHRCIIHGDLRRENWALDRAARPARLKVLDWELAGAGDPLWDVGSLLAEVVLEQLRGGGRADPWAPERRGTVRALLGAYRHAAGPLAPTSTAELGRLAGFTAARLLHVACECADQGASVADWSIQGLLAAARAIAQRGKGAGRQLRAWIE